MNLRKSQWPASLARSALLCVLTACDTPVEPEVLLWEGELVPAAGSAELSGSVAMVSNANATQIGIGIEGGPPDTLLSWAVREGSCSAPGDRVGPVSAFPPIDTAENGAGEAETVINRRLAGSAYAAELLAEMEGAGLVLACADLVRID